MTKSVVLELHSSQYLLFLTWPITVYSDCPCSCFYLSLGAGAGGNVYVDILRHLVDGIFLLRAHSLLDS